MAYQPLATFDFNKLFVPIDQVEGLQKISDKAKKTGESLVAKGKQMTADYVKKETEYLNRPMDVRTPEGLVNVSNMVGGFVGGGMKNLAKPLLVKVGAEAPAVFQGFKDYTTRVLESLKGKSVMSPATISSEINRIAGSVGMKKPEADLYHSALFDATTNGKVDVNKFAENVHDNLLQLKHDNGINQKIVGTPGNRNIPLEDMHWNGEGAIRNNYQSVNLPSSELNHVVKNTYREIVYSTPVKTSAGHSGMKTGDNFAHVRRQDLGDPRYPMIAAPATNGGTRQIIEVQSDLMQKGGLERQKIPGRNAGTERTIIANAEENISYYNKNPEAYKIPLEAEQARLKNAKENLAFYESGGIDPAVAARTKELDSLKQYESTWYQPVIRSEIKQAAVDGKNAVQFPTGETAMKIEGLGNNSGRWEIAPIFNEQGRVVTDYAPITPSGLKVGQTLRQRPSTDDWIITDVLGDGKFKAISKNEIPPSFGNDYEAAFNWLKKSFGEERVNTLKESFDISGKVDTTHGVYMKYEDMGKWLKNRLGAVETTDVNGNSWYQVPIKSEQAKQPVIMHGKTNLKTLVGGGIVTGAVAANEALSKSEYNKPDTQMFVKTPTLDRQDFTNRIVNVENEQAVATSTDPYPIIGHTGDLGKYQVNPASLKDWSKHWLGKTMTPQEFLKDPKAQDKFFNEFMNMADKYKLTHDEAAVAWHNGWGQLGTNLVDKEKRFRDYLRNAMQTPENKRYLELFNKP